MQSPALTFVLYVVFFPHPCQPCNLLVTRSHLHMNNNNHTDNMFQSANIKDDICTTQILVLAIAGAGSCNVCLSPTEHYWIRFGLIVDELRIMLWICKD